MDDTPELEEILRQYSEEFRDRDLAFEFVLVIDGLGEAREAAIKARLPDDVPVRLVSFNQPFGPERALATGYREAHGRLVLSLPSYLQLDPGDIHKVLDALEGDYDLVAGWRVPRVDPWTNRLQSWVYNRLMSSFTGVELHDLNCGLVGMRRRIVDEVLVEGNVSRFLPVLAHRKGFRVGEVRVRHLREKGRRGFFGLGVYVRRVLDVIALLFITRFTRKPLRFFGVAGGLCVLVGAAVGCYLFLDYLYGWSMRGDPGINALMMICAALIVLGVQIFAIGLVGEIIIFTNARNVQDYTLHHERGPGLPPTGADAAPTPSAAEAAGEGRGLSGQDAQDAQARAGSRDGGAGGRA
jgi:glycosyltransferase involved in cell wall biosynthesis